jgi:hypothetical protein
MPYQSMAEILQGALCLATFGAIAAVVGKMMTGTIPLHGLLAGRVQGKVEPERLLALAAAVTLSALYIVPCAITLGSAAVPRAMPAVEPWMLAALITSQVLYLAGKLLRS